MAISPVFVELRASIGQFTAKMGEAQAEIAKLSRKGAGNFDKLAAVGKGAFLGIGLAGTAIGVASVKMAGDFQQATNQLITSAGETRANIELVRKGLLDMSVQVGASATDLAKGMYMIESAGFHGAAGLQVLRAATQGAKAEGANFETVANAVTSAMNAYRVPAAQAVAVTDALVATVAHGKTRMEDLAGAISNVLPVAAAAHVSLAEVGGAMATMTGEGTGANQAATYLRMTIGQLSNPTKKAANEMAALGLSAVDIAQNLGARGLTGTLDILTNAIKSKMGPSGAVMLRTLQAAAGDTGKFQKALNELPSTQQTFVGALATMVGGTKSMQAALELTGRSAQVFKDNVKSVGDAAKNAGKDVNGWALVQQNFNQKMAVLHAQIGKLLIQLGNKLIPVIESVIGWMGKHKKIAEALAGVIGGVLFVAMAAFIVQLGIAAAEAIAATWPILAAVAALTALALGLKYAWDHCETFRKVVKWVFHEVQLQIGYTVGVVVTLMRHMADMMLNEMGAVMHGVNSLIQHMWGIPNGMKHSLNEAVRSFDNFHAHLDHGMTSLANDAYGWGDDTGTNFNRGLVNGLHNARIVGDKVVGAVLPLKKAASTAVATGYDVGGGSAPLYTPGPAAAVVNLAKATATKHVKAVKDTNAAVRAAMKKHYDQLLAQAKAAAAAQVAQLRKMLTAAQQAAREAEVAAKLSGCDCGTATIINGLMLNRGASLQTIANGGARPSVTNIDVTVQGSVTTDKQLVDAIHTGLLAKQRKTATLGFV